jgi:hypothetical protein
MQLLCKVSTVFSDVECPVCSQGFMVYWTRQSSRTSELQRGALQQALRDQHTGLDSVDAHAPAFQVADRPVMAPQRRSRPALATAIPLYS